MFRFAILGAGKTAVRFAEAAQLAGCEVAAVASRSMERAQAFADKNGIANAYGSYEALLQSESIDCAYIATVPSSHFELSMLCMQYKVPTLCEKAMFCNLREAQTAFDRSREQNTFLMEGLWSKFLPANKKAQEWLRTGRIGKPVFCDVSIGFRAPDDDENRYFNPQLGGGAALDITVYAYEIATFILGIRPDVSDVQVVRYHTGVDASEQISMRAGDCLCTLRTSFVTNLNEELCINGKKGKIAIPHPHYAGEAFLYDENGKLAEHFIDEGPQNGFIYEIQEVVDCVSSGHIESDIQSHEDTIECARLFDQIHDKLNNTAD